MVINVGINGFGRIGRIIFRQCVQNNDLKVVAINDPAVDIEYICYLIKFDSTHGRFKNDLILSSNEIMIDGNKIKIFHEKLPSFIPWQAAGVQYVVEASGMFTNLERASGHLTSESVKRVIVTAPTVDIPMMILGVNEDKISTEQKVLSSASSTLYCLAPLIKILEDNYGVAEGFITSIHAMTPSLKPLDGLCLRGKHWRDHRSIHQNIIPAATGACKALAKIIPQVKDKMMGLAFRVPIVNVSVLDVTIRLNKNTTLEDIIKCIDKESHSTMKNIINISNDEAVSSDFLGDVNSCILDENSSLQLKTNFFKLICWYENEFSYACRVVDTIIYSEKCFGLEFMSKIRNELFLSKSLFQEKHIFRCSGQKFVRSCNNIQNKAKASLNMYQDVGFKTNFPNQLKPNRVHAGLSEEKRETEIFEIWNDDVKDEKPKVRKNIESLYRSCVTFNAFDKRPGSSISQRCIKENQAVLTNKTCITENLSKISNQLTYKENYLEDELSKGYEDVIVNTVCKNNRMSGDFVSCDNKDNNDIFQTNIKNADNRCLGIKLNEPKYQEKELKSQKENVQNELYAEKDNLCIQSLVTDNDKQDTKINDSASDAKQFLADNEIEKVEANSIDPNMPIVDGDMCASKNKLNNQMYNNDEKSIVTYYEGPSTTIETGINKALEPCNSSFNRINIQNNASSDFESDISAIADNHIIHSKDLQKKILEGIINTLSVGMTLAETGSKSLKAFNTSTTISSGDRRLSDIYDKLDSASGTDSENSFEIKERKSQVLNIADLTTSLENLNRLDKICKIIEISDELSNKLFSVLDGNNHDFKRKNWSLKDLCERLKLDEFCNNVFGQSKF